MFLCFHYLPLLERKPDTPDYGDPFQLWDLPMWIQVPRDRLLKKSKGIIKTLLASY